jgi:hypothetical protein
LSIMPRTMKVLFPQFPKNKSPEPTASDPRPKKIQK